MVLYTVFPETYEEGGFCTKMMIRQPSSQMQKCHLYMPKKEYYKYMEMSGDLSLNQFFMRLIRKGVAELEEKGELQNASL
jgi:hypothetical protein